MPLMSNHNLYFHESLTLSAWQTKIDTCANSVDPDETAPNKLISSGSTLFAILFWILD